MRVDELSTEMRQALLPGQASPGSRHLHLRGAAQAIDSILAQPVGALSERRREMCRYCRPPGSAHRASLGRHEGTEIGSDK
jgi:hypothetical protein